MDVNRLQEFIDRYDGYPVLRAGLGLTIFLAGVHKLVNPSVWSAYIAPWALDALGLVGVAADVFMRMNGIVEVVTGAAILADRYTVLAAGIVSLSLVGIVVNMATLGTAFLDVLIRDIGLLALAVGVTLLAAERSASF